MNKFILIFLLLICTSLICQPAIEIKKNFSFKYLYMEFNSSHSSIPEKIPQLFREIQDALQLGIVAILPVPVAPTERPFHPERRQ